MKSISFEIMTRPRIIDLPGSRPFAAFEVWPKKTFLGRDKNESHCFTLPKELVFPMKSYFSLRDGHLQDSVVFTHKGDEYLAQIRLVRMDRSNPSKLQKHSLPKREVIQFQWKNHRATKTMFRRNLSSVFESLNIGEKNERFSVLFQLEEKSRVTIIFRMDQQEMHI